MSRRRYDPLELEFLRDNYAKRGGEACAAVLIRSPRSVYQKARELGLNRTIPPVSREDDKRIRKLCGEGLCNKCIGKIMNRRRCTIRRRRRRLGLPDLAGKSMQPTCRSCTEAVRQKTQEQCRQAGVASLAEIRSLEYRKFAEENGWPSDLRPREVQILNVLASRGVPMTRLELAEAIGMRTDRIGCNGTLALLTGNGPGGNYTATLLRRGMISVMKRASPGPAGKSCYRRSRDLYFLGPAAIAILERRACTETATAN